MTDALHSIASFPIKHRALLEQTLCLVPLFPFAGFLVNALFVLLSRPKD